MATLRAFFSYSRQDADFAGFFRLVLADGASDVNLWIDDRLDAGARYPQEIERQVATCDLFFAAMSSAWRSSRWCQRELEQVCRRDGAVEIVPLLVEDVVFDDTPAALYQAVDLRRWRIDGDAVLRAEVFARLGAPSRPPDRPSGLEEAMRTVVQWAAQSQTPDREGRAITDLATWHAVRGQGEALERARLLDALASLHLTRREWRDMLGATEAALGLVAAAGWRLPEADRPYVPEGRLDDELAFLGDLYARLALGARQQGVRSGREHLTAALAVFGEIRQPLTRREKIANTLRELGTWDQWWGDLAEARVHFEESGRLLVGLPSQRFHILQAKIKMAQVDLTMGDVSSARSLLDEVAGHFSPDGELDGHLAHQVLPHFLRTEAAWAAVVGEDVRAREALGRLASCRSRGTGGRNRIREAALHALLALPRRLRQPAVRAALLAWPPWRMARASLRVRGLRPRWALR